MKRCFAVLLALALTLCALVPAGAEEMAEPLEVDMDSLLLLIEEGVAVENFAIVDRYEPTQAEIEAVNGMWSLRGEDGRQVAIAVVYVGGMAVFGSGSGDLVNATCSITQDGKLRIEDMLNQEIMRFGGVGGEKLVGEDAAQGLTLVREIEERYAPLPEMCGEWVGEGTNTSRVTIYEDGTVKAKLPGRLFSIRGSWFGLADGTAVFEYESGEIDVQMLDGPDRLTPPMDVLLQERYSTPEYTGIERNEWVYGLIRKGN